MYQDHHKLSVLDVFWIYFVKNIDSTVQTTSITMKSSCWRYFDWLLTKISICLRVATETKSTKMEIWTKTLLSWQRAAKNKPKTVKNTSPACLVLEELLLKNLTTARTNAWFHNFSIFAPDLERPKCNFRHLNFLRAIENLRVIQNPKWHCDCMKTVGGV